MFRLNAICSFLYVLNDLSREILAGKMESRSKVIIGVENEEIVFGYE